MSYYDVTISIIASCRQSQFRENFIVTYIIVCILPSGSENVWLLPRSETIQNGRLWFRSLLARKNRGWGMRTHYLTILVKLQHPPPYSDLWPFTSLPRHCCSHVFMICVWQSLNMALIVVYVAAVGQWVNSHRQLEPQFCVALFCPCIPVLSDVVQKVTVVLYLWVYKCTVRVLLLTKPLSDWWGTLTM